MSAAGNQIRNKMIQSHPKTDRAKLAGLETLLHEKFPKMSVYLEPHLVFTKGEDAFVAWYDELSQDQVEHYNTHPTDIILKFSYNAENREVFFELDGPIHDTRRTEKTAKRNERYELNDMDYIVINEADLKFELKIPKTRPLTQEQINTEFLRKLQTYLDNCLLA